VCVVAFGGRRTRLDQGIANFANGVCLLRIGRGCLLGALLLPTIMMGRNAARPRSSVDMDLDRTIGLGLGNLYGWIVFGALPAALRSEKLGCCVCIRLHYMSSLCLTLLLLLTSVVILLAYWPTVMPASSSR